MHSGKLWPEPLIQFNPSYQKGNGIASLVSEKKLHPAFLDFLPYDLHRHQSEAIEKGVREESFIVTSGTGSGKSLTYLSSIFNYILTNGANQSGVQAIIVYPMNALINSQDEEIKKYASAYKEKTQTNFPITHRKYTGQETDKEKEDILAQKPHILLTNYMMLELILTRSKESGIRPLIFQNLKFIAFDELHTYRGRQGADVAMLVRRLKAQCKNSLICIGTSATMSSGDSAVGKKQEVANVASKFFAQTFKVDDIIIESLTPQTSFLSEVNAKEVAKILSEPAYNFTEEDVRENPLAIWLERNAVLVENRADNNYDRAEPKEWKALCNELSDFTKVDSSTCEQKLILFLQACEKLNQQLRSQDKRQTYFPYKLHQFINQTGSVWMTMQSQDKRLIELDARTSTLPSENGTALRFYQVVFSRVTGHEYLCVAKSEAENKFKPRLFRKYSEEEEDVQDGFLILQPEGEEELWNLDENIEDLPEFWLETNRHGILVVKKNFRDRIPQPVFVNDQGNISEDEKEGYLKGWFIPKNSKFEMASRTIYDKDTKEYTMYSTLGVDGRSTSTNIIAFSALKTFHQAGVVPHQQKLLSFTDNRQDTALQSGHFNDFIKAGLLRSALYHSLEKLNTLDYLNVGSAVYDELGLNNLSRLAELVQKSAESGYQYEQNLKAVKLALEYRILNDLKRGWRVILPNLEQCALLKIGYKDLLKEASHERWRQVLYLSQLSELERADVVFQILDYFRKLNATRLDLLKPNEMDVNYKLFRDNLKDGWLFSKNEDLHKPRYLRIRAIGKELRKISTASFGSRSAPGRYLKNLISKRFNEKLKGEHYDVFVQSIFDALEKAGMLIADRTLHPTVPLYQLNGIYINWLKGDGATIEPEKIKNPSTVGLTPKVNEYFREFYKTRFSQLKQIKAAEHSAQLKNEYRQRHEDEFRNGNISMLCCSPTMELGIDISDLSIVHLRNVPPNPANYTQRSGRAGRSGQGGLIFTFCSAMNAHDQHYFERRKDMVHGVVKPPQFDFSNEELIKTHLHAVWLSEVKLEALNLSIVAMLEDVDRRNYLALKTGITEKINLKEDRLLSLKKLFLKIVEDKYVIEKSAEWLNEKWIDKVLKDAPAEFDNALKRWRQLYLSAEQQLREATQTINDPTIPLKDEKRRNAEKEKSFALRQIASLRSDQTVEKSYGEQSEFYPFRYFAAEGFLPGYNFARLPVRISIPYEEEAHFISRSRFLAIREFGPRNQLYYMGTKFRSNAMPVNRLQENTISAQVVNEDGYILIGEEDKKRSVSPLDGKPLTPDNITHIHELVELTECRAVEQGKITCEEEERITIGYEISTYFKMQGNADKIKKNIATLDGEPLLEISFLPAAQIYKVNHKWGSQDREGFVIGENSGIWKKVSDIAEPKPGDEPLRTIKIYTSTTADAVYVKPLKGLGITNRAGGATTLMYALKRGIESLFEMESNEIGAELLGSHEEPNLLIYEASEGSLGVLRKLVEEKLIKQSAAIAFDICHFNKTDEEQAKYGIASYHDLLSYYNQRYHEIINRLFIKDALLNLMNAKYEVIHNTVFDNYGKQFEYLMNRFDGRSSTEKKFLEHLYKNGIRLPDEAQTDLRGQCNTIPDFVYKTGVAATVFCDGIHHDDETTKRMDEVKRKCLENAGYEVIVWHYATPLDDLTKQYPHIFKKVKE